MMMLKKCFCIVFTILISSCGYSPLYKNKFYGSIEGELYLTKILPVQGDTGQYGQILRNYLYSKMNPYGSPDRPRYSLEITLIKPFIVEKAYKTDETATLATVTQKANFILRDYDTKDILLDSNTSVISSYNVLIQAYATDVSKEYTIERNLQNLSENIVMRLSLFFKERK